MKQVLLIETDFYTRVRLDDELAERGFQITSVKRARDGFFKMKTQSFHAVVISYEYDTQEVLRTLATLRQTGNQTPVLILAKKPTESQMIQMLTFRPIEVVVKPFSIQDLATRLHQLLNHKEAGS